MRRLSRNDPCHCGSGLKYKRCCLDKDQTNNVIHLNSIDPVQDAETNVSALPPSGLPSKKSKPAKVKYNAKKIESLIAQKLEWDNILYKITAQYIVKHMADHYEWNDIAMGIHLWNSYTNIELPIYQKHASYASAIEYLVAQQIDRIDITQSLLAQKYGISPSTLSKCVRRVFDFAIGNQDKLGPDNL